MPRRLTTAALLLALPALLGAQGTGTVVGRVTLRGDSAARVPARGAAAAIVGTGLGAVAGADGRFVIAQVPAGTRTVRVRLLGYATTERSVAVVAGDTARVELVLSTRAQLLAAVRTDARADDAEAFRTRPNVGTITMDAQAMRGVPSVGEPDVVRVVQLLPGVVARNDFNTGLNVRGGEADQNLVLLDGHPMYNPFHLGGLFSTFMDATVGGLELITGAFPARYGGRLSSVLDVRSADNSAPGVHGSADVSALAASGRVGGSFDGVRGTWSVAARRTYVDALAETFTTNVFPYHFYDLQGRATYALPGDVTFALTAYGGRDLLDVNLAEYEGDSLPPTASDGRYTFGWGNRLLGASVTKEFGAGGVRPGLGWLLGDNATLQQRVSYTDFVLRLDRGDGAETQRGTVRDVRASGSFTARGRRHERSVGYEVAAYRNRFADYSSQTGAVAGELVQAPETGAVWVSDLWRASPRLLVEGGLRGEGLTGRRWLALSPRLSVKYLATEQLAFTAAAGKVTQVMHSLTGDGPMRFFDVWVASDQYVPVTAAWHYVAGAERRFGELASVRVEGYVKRYDRVLESNTSEDPGRRGDEFRLATGRSYGGDLLARWATPGGRARGWVAYTYGVSWRRRDTLEWAPSHDRRHDVNVVGTVRAGKYRLGGRFGYASGTPYTPIVGEIARRQYDPSRDRWGTGDPRIRIEALGGRRNSARFPANHRLDLDASREFRARAATITPYVSVANAYNAPNVFVYLWDWSTSVPSRRAISQFPVLPSVGVRVAF